MQDGFHHHAHIHSELPRLVILSHNTDPHWEKKLEHATQKFWKRKKKKKKKGGWNWRGKGRNERNKEQKRKTQLQSDHIELRSKFKILKLFLIFH